MRHRTKLTLAALTATLAMGVALTSIATARVFSFNSMNFRVVWTAMEFINNSGVGAVRCPITAEGSFHSQTISKVEKALIGHVSRATIAEASCSGGTATLHQESLPFHITYNGFRGILPRINSIRILLNGPRFQIRPTGFASCNGIVEANHEARGEVIIDPSTGQVLNDIPDSTPQIPTSAGCIVAEGMFRSPAGDGRITLLGTTTEIMVSLI